MPTRQRAVMNNLLQVMCRSAWRNLQILHFHQCTGRVAEGHSEAMPALHSLAHQLSDSVPPTVMPVLHSLAPQQHLRLLRLHLMCAVLFVGKKTKQSEAKQGCAAGLPPLP